MITNEQIQKLLEEAKPSIIEGFKKEITQKITWDVLNQAQAEVSKAIVEWVKAEIIPDLVKGLVESKEGLISIAPKLSELLVAEFTKSVANDFKKKMESSYERSKIVKAVFE